MKTLDALLTRVSNPSLSDPAPTKEHMYLVYQAALRAPDHAWLRPWRFIQVTGKGRGKLANTLLISAKKKSEVSEEMKKKILSMPLRAPMIIIVCANIVNRSNVPPIEQIQSCAAATQNILLALHDMGYGAFWRTGVFSSNNNKYISKELGLSKNTEVLGYLYVGTAKAKSKEIPILKNSDFVSIWI